MQASEGDLAIFLKSRAHELSLRRKIYHRSSFLNSITYSGRTRGITIKKIEPANTSDRDATSCCQRVSHSLFDDIQAILLASCYVVWSGLFTRAFNWGNSRCIFRILCGPWTLVKFSLL